MQAKERRPGKKTSKERGGPWDGRRKGLYRVGNLAKNFFTLKTGGATSREIWEGKEEAEVINVGKTNGRLFHEKKKERNRGGVRD